MEDNTHTHTLRTKSFSSLAEVSAKNKYRVCMTFLKSYLTPERTTLANAQFLGMTCSGYGNG